LLQHEIAGNGDVPSQPAWRFEAVKELPAQPPTSPLAGLKPITPYTSPRLRDGQAATAQEFEGDAALLVLDPEFQDLYPQLTADARQALTESLLLKGCREPLVVWPCQGRYILLTGYNVFPLLREKVIPFRVILEPLATREAARGFLIQHLLARNLTSLAWLRYMRGMRYLEEKQAHGGRRPRIADDQVPLGRKTATALGQRFGVTASTILRDAAFAMAANRIADICGPDTKSWLLSVESGLSHARIEALAKLDPKGLKNRVFALRLTGKLPRRGSGGETGTITLPRKRRLFARKLVERVGPEAAGEYAQAVLDLITGRPENDGADHEGKCTGSRSSPAEPKTPEV
jgi:hypothetical protein